MPIKMQIDKITSDPKEYSREKWNTATVNKYADSMKAGEKFPPLDLESGTTTLLGGTHRYKAYLLYAEMYEKKRQQPALDDAIDNDPIENWPVPITEVEVKYHVIPEGVPRKLYAASLNAKHGLPQTNAENKAIAREILQANPDYPIEDIRSYFGVALSTVYEWVGDLLAIRKEEKNATMARLHLLGWTQREIADVVGVTQKTVDNFLSNFSDLEKLLKNQIDSGLPIDTVSERNALPRIVVRALSLEGKTDVERMEALNIKTQPYDVWQFPTAFDEFGSDHPGRIPGQLIAHAFYFFTKQGDVIIDPMAGSGTTIDVSLAMGRKCYAYDIDARHERKDIIAHDIAVDGWPDRIKKADMIFWDPPYFQKMDSKNIGTDGYIEDSISKMERDEYLAFFAERLAEAKQLVKPGTKLAFLMSDWDDDTGERPGIFVWDYADLLRQASWKMIRHIQTPLSTQQVHPDIVNKFRASKRLARLERYLLIAEA